MTEYQFESLGPTLRLVVLAFLFVAALAALALIVVLAALPGQIARTIPPASDGSHGLRGAWIADRSAVDYCHGMGVLALRCWWTGGRNQPRTHANPRHQDRWPGANSNQLGERNESDTIMIPAVLSCLFVIYLYYTLHHEADPRDMDADGTRARPVDGISGATADEQLQSLLLRLEGVEERLTHMQQQGNSEVKR